MSEKGGKIFEKTAIVTRQVRRREGKIYEYGMVWVLLPREYIGKNVLVKVFLAEDKQAQPQAQKKGQPQAQAPGNGQKPIDRELYDAIQKELLKREFERLRENTYRWPYG